MNYIDEVGTIRRDHMKTLLITTPIRPLPTTFPPIGILSIMQAMRKRGINNFSFYNIDGNRPSYHEAVNHIINEKPDIIFISAVVSTAYAYTKRISCDIRASLPNTLIVLGGSMAASANIVLMKTEVDICVTGEGEITNCNIIEQFSKSQNIRDFINIPGIIMLLDGKLINTGYEKQLPKEDIYDIDWNDLETASDISQFIYQAFNKEGELANPHFKKDPRTYKSHRRGKTIASLPAAKGCVARCTFCHRFTQGIRYIPIDILETRVLDLIEKYNVGFLEIVDENFGTDVRWLHDFMAMMKRHDLLWHVGGIGVNTPTNAKQQ